jgi:hypothetical protein
LLLIGALLVGTGLLLSQILLIAFGAVAIIANLRARTIDAGLARLTGLQVGASIIGYVGLIVAYVAMFKLYLPGIVLFQT